ncbi:hypothetical protein MHYP_G00065070 [Metynnis hypsauchen]
MKQFYGEDVNLPCRLVSCEMLNNCRSPAAKRDSWRLWRKQRSRCLLGPSGKEEESKADGNSDVPRFLSPVPGIYKSQWPKNGHSSFVWHQDCLLSAVYPSSFLRTVQRSRDLTQHSALKAFTTRTGPCPRACFVNCDSPLRRNTVLLQFHCLQENSAKLIHSPKQ